MATGSPQVFTCGQLSFSADFDSGRLGAVRRGSDGAYELWIPSDCQDEGSVGPNEYRVWYYFMVSGGTPGQSITLRIMNMNVIAKVYNADLRPLVRCTSVSATWERLQQPCTFAVTPTLDLQLTWQYTFLPHPSSAASSAPSASIAATGTAAMPAPAAAALPVHFAFYYPFSYSDCQRLLENIDRAMLNLATSSPSAATAAPVTLGHCVPSAASASPPAHVVPSPRPSSLRPSSMSSPSISAPSTLSSAASPPALFDDGMYYHRELLCLSPDGRRIELLTITSRHGMHPTGEREPYLDGLFPLGDTVPRPHKFRGKPGVFISARVHPGETSSSYMLHGFLAFLLQPRNPYARALRSAFVFKVIPMLNPDGVARGHFRLDQFGVNLNRAYASPSLSRQPSIVAAKAVLKQMSTLLAPVTVPPDGRLLRALTGTNNGVFLYADLHGFTARDGCYIIGNALPSHKESRCITFTHLMQLYSPQFNAFACSFGSAFRLALANKADAKPALKKQKGGSDRLLDALRRKLNVTSIDGDGGSRSARSGGGSSLRISPGQRRLKYVRQHQHAADAVTVALLASVMARKDLLRLVSNASKNGGNNKSQRASQQPSSHSRPVAEQLAGKPAVNRPAAAVSDAALLRSTATPTSSRRRPNDSRAASPGPVPATDERTTTTASSVALASEDGGDETAADADDVDDDASTLDGKEDDDDDDVDDEEDEVQDDGDEDGADGDEEIDGGATASAGRRLAAPGTVAWAKGVPKDKVDTVVDASRILFGLDPVAVEGSNANNLITAPVVSGSPMLAPVAVSNSVQYRNGFLAGWNRDAVLTTADGVRAAVAAPAFGLSVTMPMPSPLALSPSARSPTHAMSGGARGGVGIVMPLQSSPTLAAAVAAPSLSSYAMDRAPVTSSGTTTIKSSHRPGLNAGVAVTVMPVGGYPGAVKATASLSAPTSSASVNNSSSNVVRLIDSTVAYSPQLSEGVRWGPAHALLHESEARKLQREWNGMKARMATAPPPAASFSTSAGAGGSARGAASSSAAGGGNVGREHKKGGTGRARVYRELGVVHSYTVECSCNLLSHANVVHRSHMYDAQPATAAGTTKSNAAASIVPTAAAASSPDPTVSLPQQYANVHAAAFGPSASSQVITLDPGSDISGDDVVSSAVSPPQPIRTLLVQCPAATAPLTSQVDARRQVSVVSNKGDLSSPSKLNIQSTVAASPTTPALPLQAHHPYMCQVDSLQPPLVPVGVSAAASSSLKAQGPAPHSHQATTALAASTYAFHPPLGFPAVSPVVAAAAAPRPPPSKGTPQQQQPVPPSSAEGKVSATTLSPPAYACTWGTCPHDPPAVFASLGRGLAMALLEMAGGTAAREALGSSLSAAFGSTGSGSSRSGGGGAGSTFGPPLAHNRQSNTGLPSRLSNTVFKTVGGLHRFSRISCGAEPVAEDDVLVLHTAVLNAAPPSNPSPVAVTSGGNGNGWASTLPPAVMPGNSTPSASSPMFMSGAAAVANSPSRSLAIVPDSSRSAFGSGPVHPHGLASSRSTGGVPMALGAGAGSGLAAVAAAFAARSSSSHSDPGKRATGSRPSSAARFDQLRGVTASASTRHSSIVSPQAQPWDPKAMLSSLLLNGAPQTLNSVVFPVPVMDVQRWMRDNKAALMLSGDESGGAGADEATSSMTATSAVYSAQTPTGASPHLADAGSIRQAVPTAALPPDLAAAADGAGVQASIPSPSSDRSRSSLSAQAQFVRSGNSRPASARVVPDPALVAAAAMADNAAAQVSSYRRAPVSWAQQTHHQPARQQRVVALLPPSSASDVDGVDSDGLAVERVLFPSLLPATAAVCVTSPSLSAPAVTDGTPGSNTSAGGSRPGDHITCLYGRQVVAVPGSGNDVQAGAGHSHGGTRVVRPSSAGSWSHSADGGALRPTLQVPLVSSTAVAAASAVPNLMITNAHAALSSSGSSPAYDVGGIGHSASSSNSRSPHLVHHHHHHHGSGHSPSPGGTGRYQQMSFSSGGTLATGTHSGRVAGVASSGGSSSGIGHSRALLQLGTRHPSSPTTSSASTVEGFELTPTASVLVAAASAPPLSMLAYASPTCMPTAALAMGPSAGASTSLPRK